MQRRDFLRTGVLLAAGLAGCSGSTTETADPQTFTPRQPNGDKRFTPAEFHGALREAGVAVQVLRGTAAELTLVYESDADGPTAFRREVRQIANVYTDYAIENNAARRLDVSVQGAYSDSADSFYIEAEWVREFANRNAVSGTDYFEKVVETIE